MVTPPPPNYIAQFWGYVMSRIHMALRSYSVIDIILPPLSSLCKSAHMRWKQSLSCGGVSNMLLVLSITFDIKIFGVVCVHIPLKICILALTYHYKYAFWHWKAIVMKIWYAMIYTSHCKCTKPITWTACTKSCGRFNGNGHDREVTHSRRYINLVTATPN